MLPRPQQVQVMEGRGLSFTSLKTIRLRNTKYHPVLPSMLTMLTYSDAKDEATLTLSIGASKEISVPQGYILQVDHGVASIEAKDSAGIFYGLQTLNQLLEDAHDQSIAIPRCRIIDFPAIRTRAVHLDMKYHRDALRYYYHIIDNLASVKVNTVIVEFEDKLQYRKERAVAAPDALSVVQFKNISDYAHRRHIEISPLVQGLGHASFILKHEQYKRLRDDPSSDYVFDPLNPDTYAVQFSLYEDAIAATPYGKYLHVGGDEVGHLGNSALARASGMTPLQLQMFWLNKVAAFANAHGRIPIFWDDMVFKISGLYQTTTDTMLTTDAVSALWKENKKVLEENIRLFPVQCMYARWNYEAPLALGNKLAIDWYSSHGLPVMPATAAQQWHLLLPRDHSNFRSIRDFCRLTHRENIPQILCTVWDDSSPHYETLWRGLFDFASLSWNDTDCTAEDANATFRHRFYSPKLADSVYEFQDKLENAMPFWETAFLAEGDRENYRADLKLIDFPDPGNPRAWSKRYANRIDSARNAVGTYDEIKKIIAGGMRLPVRNRYALQVMNEINELQVYSAKVIMAIHHVDISSGSRKDDALQETRKRLKEFQVIREKLEKVFAETRIMRNPAGYVRDSNIRMHWADVSDNTDWMYWIELKMNRKLLDWLNSQSGPQL